MGGGKYAINLPKVQARDSNRCVEPLDLDFEPLSSMCSGTLAAREGGTPLRKHCPWSGTSDKEVPGRGTVVWGKVFQSWFCYLLDLLLFSIRILF